MLYWFAGSMVLIGLSLGWPLGDLAAHWALCALVLQRCLRAGRWPLLLAGLPDDLIRWLSRSGSCRCTAHPGAASAAPSSPSRSCWSDRWLPVLVAAQASSAAARVGLALVVLCGGIDPLATDPLGRLPGILRPRAMIRAVYLVAQAVVPVFLSFLYILARNPLYPTFARSVHVIHLRPLNDQQVSASSEISFCCWYC